MTSEGCLQEAAGVTHREESVDYISLNGAQWFVLNDHKNLFFFLQVDEVTEPGFFGKPDVMKRKRCLEHGTLFLISYMPLARKNIKKHTKKF